MNCEAVQRGKRRFNTGADDPTASIASLTDRGYTGHEHLQEVGLVHMNGRVYEPALGRFMSADPFVQDPYNTQSLNRFGYALNNPLAYTDPSGFLSFSKFISISLGGGLFGPAYFVPFQRHMIEGFLRDNQWAQSALMASSIACGPYAPLCAAGNAAYLASIQGGSLGDIFKAAVIAGVTTYAFQGAAGISNPYIGIAASAAVGCVSSAAGGGNCARGAVAAGVGAAVGRFGPQVFDAGRIGNGVIAAVVGGTTSVIGGGRFENGAFTSAFAYAVGQIANGAPSDAHGRLSQNNTPQVASGEDLVPALGIDVLPSQTPFPAQLQTLVDIGISASDAVPTWVPQPLRGVIVDVVFTFEVRALGAPFFAQQSYKGGVPTFYGDAGSSRADAGHGRVDRPDFVVDLKTNYSTMSVRQLRNYQRNLPEVTPIYTIRVR